MRTTRIWVVSLTLGLVAAGCSGSGDQQTDVAIAPQAPATIETTAPEDLRAMPRGACHDALAAENDILRGFWHGAAPLNLAWLDEQQRPPSRFDLESAVALVRPVSGRIRVAVTTVCAR